MDTDNLERYLNSFGKQVVNRAKGNLQKAKGGGTALEKSISFTVTADADSLVIRFSMLPYGKFVDKGVSGNEKTRKYKNYKNKNVSSPYRYKKKQPPPNILAKWISKKGIKGRDKKTGRYISNLSLAFVMGRAIKRDGIQGLSFFQKPLALGLKQFGSELLQGLKLDIIENFNTLTTD
jgi:hypothetical protein